MSTRYGVMPLPQVDTRVHALVILNFSCSSWSPIEREMVPKELRRGRSSIVESSKKSHCSSAIECERILASTSLSDPMNVSAREERALAANERQELSSRGGPSSARGVLPCARAHEVKFVPRQVGALSDDGDLLVSDVAGCMHLISY